MRPFQNHDKGRDLLCLNQLILCMSARSSSFNPCRALQRSFKLEKWRSEEARKALTMKVSVAALAPVTPPETGASMTAGCATLQPGKGRESWWRGAACSCLAMSLLATGSMVEQSTSKDGRIPPSALMTPSLPKYASRTLDVEGNMDTMSCTPATRPKSIDGVSFMSKVRGPIDLQAGINCRLLR